MVASNGRSTPVGHGRRESIAALPQTNSTSVKVVVRIRPEQGTARPGARFQRIVVQPLSNTTLQIESSPAGGATSASAASALAKTGGKSSFTFDRVIGPEEGQPDVYDEAQPLIDSFLEGFNATVIAYGQTAAGKSYTMGTDMGADWTEANAQLGPERLGITPRAIAEIFDRMKEITKETRGGTTFKAKLSYIEIYNEDLIDLLAGEHDARPTVQIREDKGIIIWSGLKEVAVTSATEVMNLLIAGSSLRQTNATDMNAQSSRSHAIFSLTLEQRRHAGSGAPAPPASPGSARIPSRTSMLPRVTSPTPSSRSSTPTNDRPASRISGLRPPSSISGRATSPQPVDDYASAGADSWTTVTSKFHFVDLAGSERLKRTAAAGERVKEGISINSGLHALGNVISALGDPTKKTTHIPYRDSKLTRLLQDSLGGNARTMMIACISATELNLNETLSTVKYANRARNIKNSATVNEVEVGWDDVDYLQRTILKLRGEMASLKAGGSIPEENLNRRSIIGDDVTAQGELVELQRRYAELTAELATARSSVSAVYTSLSREEFATAIEPVVEEYEKSLSALESQLALTRAALGHSEEEIKELEARVEEEVRANEASGSLIDELKGRVSKLGEREATVEAYVRDLEAKLKDYGDQDESHGSAVSDLRKEVTKNREQSEKTEQYILDLETRLGKSEETSSSLRRQIEVLERDVQRREEAYRELEGRLSLLDTSGDHKLLLAEIDEKDKRVLDLERTLDDLKSKTLVAEQEQERLEKVAAMEKEAKEELQSRVRTLERASVVAAVTPRARTDSSAPSLASNGNDDDPFASSSSAASPDAVMIAALEHQLAKLQQSYDSTLADLETANVKYRNSLREIEELNSQMVDSKSHHAEDSGSMSSSAPPSPSPSSSRFVDRNVGTGLGLDEATDEVEELASRSPIVATPSTPPARTPKSRRSMPLAPQHRLSFLGRGQGAPAHTHARSASLSQELSLAVSSQASSPPSPRLTSPAPGSLNRETIYGVLTPSTDRSYEQMRKEVLKLQSVLAEREEEIAALEANLHQLRGSSSPPDSLSPSTPRGLRNGNVTPPMLSPLSPSSDFPLSPNTLAAFDAVKSSSAADRGPDETSNAARLDDLMRAMAKKESAHREAVEELSSQLSAVRRQHDELTVLSRDQVTNVSTEITQLRTALEGRPEASHYDDKIKSLQEEVEAKHAEIESSRSLADAHLSDTTTKLVKEHERAISSVKAEAQAAILQLQQEHADILKRTAEERDALIQQKESEHADALRSLAAQHDSALSLRKSDHDTALAVKTEEMATALQRKEDEHSEAIKRHEIERAALLSGGQEEAAQALQKLEEEHAAVLEAREADLTSSMEKLKVDHEQQLSDRDAKHESALSQLRGSHDATLADTTSSHTSLLDRLRDEHSAALAALAATHSATLSSAADDHETRSRQINEDHDVELASLRHQHDTAFATRSAEHSSELSSAADRHATELQEKVASLTAEHGKALEDLAATQSSAIQQLQDEHSTRAAALVSEHEAAISSAAESHNTALAAQREEHEASVKSLEEKHASETEALRQSLIDDHSASTALLAEQHVAAQRSLSDEHSAAIDALKTQHETALDALRQSLADEHGAATSLLAQEHEQAQRSLSDGHSSALESLKEEHARAIEAHAAKLNEATGARGEELGRIESERDEARKAHAKLASAHEQLVAEHAQAKESLVGLTSDRDAALQTITDLKQQHDSTLSAHGVQLASLQAAVDEHRISADATREASLSTEKDLQEARDALAASKQALADAQADKDRLQAQVDQLQSSDKEITTRTASLSKELEDSRAALAKSETDLVQARQERDALSSQLAQLSTAEPNSISDSMDRAMSPTSEVGRSSPSSRHDSRLMNGVGIGKPPPPTPPPSMPPPPTPAGLPNGARRSSSSSIGRSSISGTESTLAPSTRAESTTIDPRIAKKFEEQESQIARLSKQLTHCESDLQANIDLVNTLESALNDSERNLRKARTQMNDLAKERDAFSGQNDALRLQIQDAHTEVETVRHSVIEVESRLQEERYGKERAKQELQRRLDQVQSKKSKFACF